MSITPYRRTAKENNEQDVYSQLDNGVVAKNVSVQESELPTGAATDDALILLRRLVKLLQSSAIVDIQSRQRVTIDAITAGIGGTGIALLGLNSLVGPVTNWPTTGAPIQQPVGGAWQPVWVGPIDQRFLYKDACRLTYNQGIRSHLVFT